VSDPVLDRLVADRAGLIERIAAFVACPSVSTDPGYAEGMAAARCWLIERLTTLGFSNVRELSAAGHPSVAAEWLGAPGAPTFLVYGHYDVQPPDPVELWRSPPFTLTEREGRLYGRGVSDDKAPSLIAIETLGAFLSIEKRLPVNVKIFFEGEEETGSRTLGAILAANREALAADAVLSADGARWRADLDTVTVATRGNAGFEITLRTADKDLHSGRYGGAVPNALHAMARLIASLHGADGGIAVEGFFDGVVPPGANERAALAAIPFDEDGFHAGLGTTPAGEAGYSTLERLWLRPTLDVNGLWGGYTGAGGKTVIANEAHAKISMRIVPGQDPRRCVDAVKAHLTRHTPPGATLTFGPERGMSAAYAVPDDHPLLLAVEDTLEAETGTRPLRVRMGATLPVTDLVRAALGIDTVMFSFSTSDEDYHAPNEFFRTTSIEQGLSAWTALIRRLGRQSPGTYARFRGR
jgi:acetylornithine deacetylase/succinyl-diaminopimelate desuccinylase-like protein